MKHLIALLLISSILVSLVACTGEPSPDSPQDTSTQTSQNLEETTKEIERAISYGLVPEEIQGDYNTGITFRQYSQMLTNLIGIWDESRLDEWKNIIALAAESDEEMRREDGILATAYAMVLMGADAPENFFHLDIDPVMEQLDDNGDTPS